MWSPAIAISKEATVRTSRRVYSNRKGICATTRRDGRYLYRATEPSRSLAARAVRQIIDRLRQGSVEELVSGDGRGGFLKALSGDELRRLEAFARDSRKRRQVSGRLLFLDVGLWAYAHHCRHGLRVLWVLRVRTAAERHAACTAASVPMLPPADSDRARRSERLSFAVVLGTATSPGVRSRRQPRAGDRRSLLSLQTLLCALLGRRATLIGPYASEALGILIGLELCSSPVLCSCGWLSAPCTRAGWHPATQRNLRLVALPAYACATPISVGWLSPVLILPDGWERWADSGRSPRGADARAGALAQARFADRVVRASSTAPFSGSIRWRGG